MKYEQTSVTEAGLKFVPNTVGTRNIDFCGVFDIMNYWKLKEKQCYRYNTRIISSYTKSS
jgi:hypothetical protein